MAPRRLSIPLSPYEVRLLQHLYVCYRIPSDQYRRRPNAAARFLATWNSLAGRDDCWEDIYHFIITRRKRKRWPTFGDDYLRLADPDWDALSEVEWGALRAAYVAVMSAHGSASDSLLFDPMLGAELARDFARRAGRVVSSEALTALIVSRRKKGEWCRVRPDRANGRGFSDIDEVDGGRGFGDIDEVA